MLLSALHTEHYHIKNNPKFLRIVTEKAQLPQRRLRVSYTFHTTWLPPIMVITSSIYVGWHTRHKLYHTFNYRLTIFLTPALRGTPMEHAHKPYIIRSYILPLIVEGRFRSYTE